MAPRKPNDRKKSTSRPPRGKPQQNKGNVNVPRFSETWLFGLHTVEAALKNPKRKIHRLKASRNAAAKLQNALSLHNPPVDIVDIRELDKILGADTVHQGVFLEADPLPLLDVEDLDGRSPILILDQVTDPHNVGAVLRSAAAFGVGALIMTARHSPPLAGISAKIASGGLEHVPVCHVGNLARALEDIGKAGYWRIGLDGEGDSCLEDIDLNGPVALVLGAEGKGLRRLTMENCDQIAKIKTAADLTSLNVSNAAAVALHTVHIATTTK